MSYARAIKRLVTDADFDLHKDGTQPEQKTILPDGSWLAWRGPGPAPSLADIQASHAAWLAEQQQALADAQALRQQIATVAGSAVGAAFDQLTAAQVRALVAILLRNAGALDKAGKVKPLADWVR